MGRRMRFLIPLPLALGLSVPTQASAHHSTEGLYDRARTVEFVGILQRLDMINPHVWFHFNEVAADGTIRKWRVEADGPGQIRRTLMQQFGVVREFEEGKTYKVQVEPGYANETDGYLKALTFGDGAVFNCCAS
jgi:hypothetical protein